MAPPSPQDRPVLILAARESGGSLLSALLDRHPAFRGGFQINLLAFEEVWQFVKYGAIPRDSVIHGIQRLLAQELMAEQTMQSVQTVNRWLQRRSQSSSAEVHAELRGMVAPKRLVDYSPLVGFAPEAMERAVAALPEGTRIIHLTRDPVSHAKAMILPVWQCVLTSLDFWDRRGAAHPCMDVFEIGEQLVDWSVRPPVFDPQFYWHRVQIAAKELLATLPRERWIHVDMGAVESQPHAQVGRLLEFLDEDAGDDTVEAMIAADPPDEMTPGPYTAPFGMDFEMVSASIGQALMQGARAGRDRIDASRPLPWRGDGETLLPEVRALARDLGYSVSD